METIQSEYSKLEKIFPDNYASVVSNIATLLNQILNHIPDIEPSHSNELHLSKLDKKVEKYLNNMISRLKKAESELVLEHCLSLIFADNPRILSHHGVVLFVQLLLRQTPGLLHSCMGKCLDSINSNKHRYQRLLIALRAFSQVGISDLSEGIKIWFDIMLPLISTKSLTNYVATYLSFILDHHKANISKLSHIESLIDCDQYLDFYDMVNDKTLVLSKEAAQKFKVSFQQIRNIFYQNLSGSEYFEPILSNLVAESSPKQTELLDILTKIVFSNREVLISWRKIYSKTMLQSTIFLEHLVRNHGNSLKSLKELRETLNYFEQQTSNQVASLLTKEPPSAKETSKHHFYNKKSQKISASTIETERLKSFNKLVKQLNKQNSQRTSFLSMAFRRFILFALLIGGFFYWDINHNKSVYVNSIQSELKRYGLLDQTLKIVETLNKAYKNAQDWILYNVPIWYEKAMVFLTPYVKKTSKLAVEYSDLAWNKSEPYREKALVYYEQSYEYIQTNFPILVETFLKYTEIAIEKSIIGYNLLIEYSIQGRDLLEVKLGMEKGELNKIALDAYKVLLEKLAVGSKWLSEKLTHVY